MEIQGDSLTVTPQEKSAKCILVPQQDATLNFNDKSDEISIENTKGVSELTLVLQNAADDAVLKLKNLTLKEGFLF